MIILRKISPVVQQTIVADTVSGTIDSSNQTFYTSYEYKIDHITVHYNGQALHPDYDFIQTGVNEITFIYVQPESGDNISATYELDA